MDQENDLERFMAHWKDDPKNMCHFVGRAVARLAFRNFNDFFFATSTAYFSFREICERIDFIYANYQRKVGGECGKLLKELVEIEEQNKVVCLKDIRGKHSCIRLMLLRDTVEGYPTYSVRYFVKITERTTGYLKKHWSGSRPTFKKVLRLSPEWPLSRDEQQYEINYDFWNFRKPTEILEGVIVYPESQGFYDLMESRSVADFIVLTSNLLGYGKNECIKSLRLVGS